MFIWKFPSDALYLSPYSNHSNENGYKKGCPRALVTYIYAFIHSQI